MRIRAVQRRRVQSDALLALHRQEKSLIPTPRGVARDHGGALVTIIHFLVQA